MEDRKHELVLIGADQFQSASTGMVVFGGKIRVGDEDANRLLSSRDLNGNPLFCRAEDLSPATVKIRLTDPARDYRCALFAIMGPGTANVPPEMAGFLLSKKFKNMPVFERVEGGKDS